MGCFLSSDVQYSVNTAGWTSVFVNFESGDVSISGDGGQVLSKCTLGAADVQPHGAGKHWIEQKVNATWEDTKDAKLGGKCTYTCLTTEQLKELWTNKPKMGSGEDNPVEPKMSPSVVRKGVGPVGGMHLLLAGKVEFGDRTFLVTGEINDRVNICDQKDGRCVLSMSQWKDGSNVKFFTTNVERHDRSSDSEQNDIGGPGGLVQKANEAFCGTSCRDNAKENTERGVNFLVRPDILEKLPIGLMAMAVMYSNIDLNDIEA